MALLNQPDVNHLTPLLSTLISNPRAPNSTSEDRRYETVKLLLQHGVDPEPECLHHSSIDPFHNLLGYLCCHCNKVTGIIPQPLLYATAFGYHRIMERLLTNGCDVGITFHTDFRHTPILTAVRRRDVVAVKLLLEKGRISKCWKLPFFIAYKCLEPRGMIDLFVRMLGEDVSKDRDWAWTGHSLFQTYITCCRIFRAGPFVSAMAAEELRGSRLVEKNVLQVLSYRTSRRNLVCGSRRYSMLTLASSRVRVNEFAAISLESVIKCPTHVKTVRFFSINIYLM